MTTSFKSSFLKGLRKLKDQRLKDQVARCIEQVEAAENLSELTNVKKM